MYTMDFGVITTCQSQLIKCNKCTTLAQDFEGGGHYAHIGREGIWKISVPFSQYCWESKTFVKIVYKKIGQFNERITEDENPVLWIGEGAFWNGGWRVFLILFRRVTLRNPSKSWVLPLWNGCNNSYLAIVRMKDYICKLPNSTWQIIGTKKNILITILLQYKLNYYFVSLE